MKRFNCIMPGKTLRNKQIITANIEKKKNGSVCIKRFFPYFRSDEPVFIGHLLVISDLKIYRFCPQKRRWANMIFHN